MGKRDDRLHAPEAFKQALMTRPVVRSGSFSIYRIPYSDGMRLGFVLPKKLVKCAVQRNQVKRWARAIFRRPGTTSDSGVALVVRLTASMPKSQWLDQGREKARQDLSEAMEKALAGIQKQTP